MKNARHPSISLLAGSWRGRPEHLPVSLLRSRARIDHRHLALVRENREREPLHEPASAGSPSPAPEERGSSRPRLRRLSLLAGSLSLLLLLRRAG